MQKEESRTDLGKIRIYKQAIAQIAAVAAQETEGVKKVGGNLKSKLLEKIAKSITSPIMVEISKNEEVRIDIPLVIKYGFSIPEVASKVQENVRNSLEKMTNLSIKDVNVNVQSIERG